MSAKIRYGVLANDTHEQLDCVLKLLRHPDVRALIHIDVKAVRRFGEYSVDRSFAEVLPFSANAPWGGFSIVRATVELLKKALTSNFDFFILLSGTTAPVVNQNRIIETLSAAGKEVFMTLHPFPNRYWGNDGGIERYESYWFNDWKHALLPRGAGSGLEARALRGLGKAVTFLRGRKSPPGNNNLFWGSQWWAASRHICQFLLDKLEREPEWLRFFRYSHLPDEMFFQSLVGESISEDLICNDNLLYLEWQNGRPIWLSAEQLRAIDGDDFLFARKVKLSDGSQQMAVLRERCGL